MGTNHGRPPLVDPVDTTGAGDTFAGVLAAKIAQGETKEKALREAVEAAAQSTTTLGAQPWRLEDELL